MIGSSLRLRLRSGCTSLQVSGNPLGRSGYARGVIYWVRKSHFAPGRPTIIPVFLVWRDGLPPPNLPSATLPGFDEWCVNRNSWDSKITQGEGVWRESTFKRSTLKTFRWGDSIKMTLSFLTAFTSDPSLAFLFTGSNRRP